MTITCADCGATQIIPFLPTGATARCHRCARLLARRSRTGFALSLACAIAICILLPAATLTPVMDATIRKLGFIESRLVSSVPVIFTQVWFPISVGFLVLAFLFPAFRALFQVIILGSLRWGWRISQRGRIFRWSEQLRIALLMLAMGLFKPRLMWATAGSSDIRLVAKDRVEQRAANFEAAVYEFRTQNPEFRI